MYYLAYGMLTDPGIMPRGRFVGPATLQGWRPEMLLFANIVPDPTTEFTGVLWQIDKSILRELDQIEGYPELYSRRTTPVKCQTYGQIVDAWVYVMTPSSRARLVDSTPTKNYLRSVRNGYNHAGIWYPFRTGQLHED